MDGARDVGSEIVDFWSRELLFRMDWKRFADLTARLVGEGGYRTRLLEQDRDGGGLWSVSEGLLRRQVTHLRFGPWKSRMIGVAEVRAFYTRLLEERMHNGVFVTVGEFSAEARSFANGRMIELIDGDRYLETVRRIPIMERDRLLHEWTQDDFTTPSCPACGERMGLRECEAPAYEGRGEDLRFVDLIRVKRQIRCDLLTVEATGRVFFERPAYCRTMIVRGQVTGEFVCEGTVEVHPGARIAGNVAARSIRMFSGGVVDGEMRIAKDGEVRPVREDGRDVPVWGCTAYPRCKMVWDC